MIVHLAHAALRQRRLDDESVVFDGYSGETHRLDGLAAVIMRFVLESEAVDIEHLCTELAGPHQQDHAAGAMREAVVETVATLRRIGLVRVDDGKH